jgi:hypothetical protein
LSSCRGPGSEHITSLRRILKENSRLPDDVFDIVFLLEGSQVLQILQSWSRKGGAMSILISCRLIIWKMLSKTFDKAATEGSLNG